MTITTKSYPGINGKAVTVDFDEDMIYYSGDELKPGARDMEDLVGYAFAAFGDGLDDERIMKHWGHLDAYCVKYIKSTVCALREVGGLWIAGDCALVEGRGVVEVSTDPQLLALWMEYTKDAEIVED